MIDISKPIEVRTGDYRREWQLAKVTAFGVDMVHCQNCDEWELEEEKDEEFSYHRGDKHANVWVSVEFEDGCVQRLSDIFGRDKDEWRYK